jgi:hypothetical protein
MALFILKNVFFIRIKIGLIFVIWWWSSGRIVVLFSQRLTSNPSAISFPQLHI